MKIDLPTNLMALLFVFLLTSPVLISGGIEKHEARGSGTYLKINKNSIDNIRNELNLIDFGAILKWKDGVNLKDIDFEVEDFDKQYREIESGLLPANFKIPYKCSFLTSRTLAVGSQEEVDICRLISDYIRLRMSGFSSLGATYVLVEWYSGEIKYPDSISKLSIRKFEKLNEIPSGIQKFINHSYLSEKNKEYYLMRDSEACWLLLGSGEFCRFIGGFDSIYFNNLGFALEFEKETLNHAKISYEESIILSRKILDKWHVEWIPPGKFLVPGM